MKDAYVGITCSSLMQNSIRTALMDSLIWPSRIVVPMIPGDFRYFPTDRLLKQAFCLSFDGADVSTALGRVIDMGLGFYPDHSKMSRLGDAASWSFIQLGNWR